MTTAAPNAPVTPSLGTQVRDLFADLLAQLSNFWFGMLLLAIWGVMTLIGVVVDQGKDPSFYLTTYPAALARLVLRLDLQNIYHSTAYVAMIGLIIACMTLATFKRVIPNRLPPLRPVKIDKIPLNATVTMPGDPDTVRGRIEAFFEERGWLVRKREAGGVEWTFADKHNWARRGVLIAHVGFVVIAAGTTMYWAWGYSGQTTIVSGTGATIAENGTKFKLDRFAYKIDPIQTRSGIVYQPMDYVSYLHVAGKDGVFHPAVLRVNQPVDVDGTLYYQASYGFAVPFTVTKDGQVVAGSPGTPLKEGEGFQIGQTTRFVRYSRFVGTIDARGGIGADPRPNNPGVALDFFDGDQNIGQVLVPLERGLDLGNGYRLNVGRYTLYSGIQYRHDPGIPLVGIGAFVLLAGLCISFYFLPARLYVRVDEAAQGVAVGIAATTVKGYEIFEEQFQSLVEALRREANRPAVAVRAPAVTVPEGVS
jgi:cytochrome c biogenesis protein